MFCCLPLAYSNNKAEIIISKFLRLCLYLLDAFDKSVYKEIILKIFWEVHQFISFRICLKNDNKKNNRNIIFKHTKRAKVQYFFREQIFIFVRHLLESIHKNLNFIHSIYIKHMLEEVYWLWTAWKIFMWRKFPYMKINALQR